MLNILFIGDVVGKPGREFLTSNLNRIRNEYNVDFCIANGENSAHGNSITADCLRQLISSGVDFVTMGNHTYSRDVTDVFDDFENIIRPANFPSHLPGYGSGVFDIGKAQIGVINVWGRVFLDPLDSTFTACDNEIAKIKDKCDFIIVDFHAETTSEKGAMGHYLDGKVLAVLGTHTHVQTADEQILPSGTAFITDVGMTGVKDSVLGVKKDIIVDRFAKHINKKFELAEGQVQFNAVLISVDEKTNKATKITRINL